MKITPKLCACIRCSQIDDYVWDMLRDKVDLLLRLCTLGFLELYALALGWELSRHGFVGGWGDGRGNLKSSPPRSANIL